jgi:F-type H+-transporting ATPase subunit beta
MACKTIMNTATASASRGIVVPIRGSVVGIRFDTYFPPIYTLLRVGAKNKIAIEVLTKQNANHVRGIALTPAQGLVRGAALSGLQE